MLNEGREVVAVHLAGSTVLCVGGFGARLQAFVLGGEAFDFREGASAFLRFPEALSHREREGLPVRNPARNHRNEGRVPRDDRTQHGARDARNGEKGVVDSGESPEGAQEPCVAGDFGRPVFVGKFVLGGFAQHPHEKRRARHREVAGSIPRQKAASADVVHVEREPVEELLVAGLLDHLELAAVFGLRFGRLPVFAKSLCDGIVGTDGGEERERLPVVGLVVKDVVILGFGRLGEEFLVF